jgi:hypothetical protein
MKTPLPIVIGALIIIAIGAYFLIPKKSQTTTTPVPTSESMTSTTPAPTVDNSDLMQGGSSYKDTSGFYTFLYPNDYKLDTSDPIHARIFKTGATQTGQTEMHDGVLMVFEVVDLGEKTLKTWVDDNIKATTADGTLKVIEPVTAAKINNYPGFTYKTQGLGEAKYFVLQKDGDSKNALVITTSVQDPKNVGFQTDVDKVLSTIQLLK